MLGSGYLLMDEVVRRDGFTPVERRHFFRRLAARDRRALEAYRDGVNAFIAQVTAEPRRLPVEFGGTAPAPWTTDDSVAVAILELLVEGANGGQEVIEADLLLDLLERFPSRRRAAFDDRTGSTRCAAPTTIAASDAPCSARTAIASRATHPRSSTSSAGTRRRSGMRRPRSARSTISWAASARIRRSRSGSAGTRATRSW
jgi:acyl-homoserine lactone acylase PvdQ